MRIRRHNVETINRVLRETRALRLELGREPTPEEIALRAGMTEKKLRATLQSVTVGPR